MYIVRLKKKKTDHVLLPRSTVAVSLCNVRWVVEVSRVCLDFGTVTDVGDEEASMFVVQPDVF